MTEKDRQLLIKHLCARIAYGVKVRTAVSYKTLDTEILNAIMSGRATFKILPMLRPMDSMTEEEICKIENIIGDRFTYRDGTLILNTEEVIRIPICKMSNLIQFMYSRHLDFDDLISMGLALKAPEGMYGIQ